ncbi:uncharacterized protein N7484_010542 [Penicillium longicatenatum]|uniref:uncharacterized protein n=1 Tax=Penicillium longicatenatum TaxID=1561947 RepID=UPI0025485AB6|nr:uncharacterized protein N7484_010542 [Penicillium longicatenatum]KAJ5630442.1 hypothetical protein N7484_010542 [Penicillium longicatenatum]
MAVDCISMASLHHPHHPYNQASNSHLSRSTSVGSASGRSRASSNNPYARFMSPAPSVHSQSSEYSTSSVPSVWWTGYPEHHPVEPKRRRDSTSSIDTKGGNGVPRRSRSGRYSRNSTLVNPDIIDELDDITIYSYHHEGPYDAVRPERNRVSQHSPLEAVRESNEEALRATPRDKIVDSLQRHRPLDGTAFFPPGTTDPNGQSYQYEEGSNMMNEYGNFLRLPGKKFTDEDFKNDPFYTQPISNPFTQLKKKLSLRRRKNRHSMA